MDFHAPFFGPEIFLGSRLPHLPQDLVVLVMVTGVHLAARSTSLFLEGTNLNLSLGGNSHHLRIFFNPGLT